MSEFEKGVLYSVSFVVALFVAAYIGWVNAEYQIKTECYSYGKTTVSGHIIACGRPEK